MERKKIRLSEIPPGTPIPEGVDVINDYPNEFMKIVINHSTDLYLRASRKADRANRFATLAIISAGVAFGMAAAVLMIVATVL